MKRVLSAAAALTLTLSLGASALAYSGTITLNGTKLDTAKLPDAPAGSVMTLSNMKAAFVQGTTFVPASLLSKLEGYTAQVKGGDVTITTPNADELVRLARSIIDKVEMGATMKLDAAGMAEMYNIPSDCFTEAVGFFPMMISADTIVIGKVADGKLDAAKEALEAQRALTQQNFEQYLPEPLERAKNGQIVTSGDYIMLIISGDNDTAIRMFQDGVK